MRVTYNPLVKRAWNGYIYGRDLSHSPHRRDGAPNGDNVTPTPALTPDHGCNVGVFCYPKSEDTIQLGDQFLVQWNNRNSVFMNYGAVDIYFYDPYNPNVVIANKTKIPNGPGYYGFTVNDDFFKSLPENQQDKDVRRQISYTIVGTGDPPGQDRQTFSVQGNPSTYHPNDQPNSITQAKHSTDGDKSDDKSDDDKSKDDSTNTTTNTDTDTGTDTKTDDTDASFESTLHTTEEIPTTIDGSSTSVPVTLLLSKNSKGGTDTYTVTSGDFSFGDVDGPGDRDSDGSLSGGAIAGIVIGILAFLVLLLLAIWWLLRRRRRAATAAAVAAAGGAAGGQSMTQATAGGAGGPSAATRVESGNSDTPLLRGSGGPQSDSFMSDFAGAAGLGAGAAGAAAAAARGTTSRSAESQPLEVMPQVYMDIPRSTRSSTHGQIPGGPGGLIPPLPTSVSNRQSSNDNTMSDENAQRLYQQVQSAFNQPLAMYSQNGGGLDDNELLSNEDGVERDNFIEPQRNDEINPSWRQQVANDRMQQHLAQGDISLMQPEFNVEGNRATASSRSNTPLQQP
ncbi:hypothetical protein H4219_004602 [Mycoemilia scoparia]|uniref:Uncharacterized protein n=1 Tax=Mycoemilia scoparia TaxID=417184 RepID=A0A9W8DR34_9FUNG|nr:hypothetical protein H4219_004602 [Mycoemilia scoparia]